MQALSPTAYQFYCDDPDRFYRRYIKHDLPREPQTLASAIGAAFDATVKTAMRDMLGWNDFSFNDLYEAQVETQYRDRVKPDGEHLFAAYVKSGAYARLMNVLKDAEQINLDCAYTRRIGGVKLQGQPDLSFVWKKKRFILDWKVRGFLSNASPTPGYVICQDGFYGRPTKRNGEPHPDCTMSDWEGLAFNANGMHDSYVVQPSMYAWLLDRFPSDSIIWIDELVSKGNKKIRVATHRAFVDQRQESLLDNLRALWNRDWPRGPLLDQANRLKQLEDLRKS